MGKHSRSLFERLNAMFSEKQAAAPGFVSIRGSLWS
jgi:hypothetical protein